MYTKYIISVTDPTISVAELAKWIRKVIDGPNTISRALTLARTIIFGESWSPEFYFETLVPAPPKGVTVTKVNVLDEDDLLDIERRAKAEFQQNLLQRAVGGDAEAAIEYCRLDAEGKILRYANFPRA